MAASSLSFTVDECRLHGTAGPDMRTAKTRLAAHTIPIPRSPPIVHIPAAFRVALEAHVVLVERDHLLVDGRHPVRDVPDARVRLRTGPHGRGEARHLERPGQA